MSYEVGDWGKLYGHKFHLCVNPIFMINAEDTSKTKYIQPCFELPLKIRIKFYDIVCPDYRLRHISIHFFFFFFLSKEESYPFLGRMQIVFL